MPSMKCYECGKVKRCKMYLRHPSASTLSEMLREVDYLCAPCAKELGR